MPNSPARVRPEVAPAYTEREQRAVAARREMERGLLAHTLRAEFDRLCAEIDASVAFEVSQSMLENELKLLRWGLGEAGDSAAAAKLVADRIELLSRTDSVILLRHAS
jgi:hypothetical protein